MTTDDRDPRDRDQIDYDPFEDEPLPADDGAGDAADTAADTAADAPEPLNAADAAADDDALAAAVYAAPAADALADTPLRSAAEFEDELARLGALVADDVPHGYDDPDAYPADEDAWSDDAVSDADAADLESGELLADELLYPAGLGQDAAGLPGTAADAAGLADLDDEDRLRQPRAQTFRQRWRMQLGLLPLALFLIALGVYLLARAQDIGDLPAFADVEIGAGALLVVAFTFVFHALLSGRRERGLLFLGLWVWVTAGALVGLIEFVEPEPAAGEWWPLLLAALAATLLATFLLERTHDARLLLLASVIAVAAATAYWVTSGEFDDNLLDDAADYWPLLVSVLGIGLVPLVFRRRTG